MEELMAIPDDLRVDAEDVRTLQTLLDNGGRKALRVTTAPYAGDATTENGVATGCVLKTSTVSLSLSPNKVTFNAGLKVAFGGESVGGSDPDGEVFELADPVDVSDACPTVGDPTIWIMARSTTTLADGTLDERVLYDPTVASKEKLATIPTRSTRSIVFAHVVDLPGVDLMLALGYHRVCRAVYNSGTPVVAEWYGLFANCLWQSTGAPQTGNRLMASVAQFAHAVAKRLTKITGYVDEAWWLADPVMTLAAAKAATDAHAAAISGVQAVNVIQQGQINGLLEIQAAYAAALDVLQVARGAICRRLSSQTIGADSGDDIIWPHDETELNSVFDGQEMLTDSDATKIYIRLAGVYKVSVHAVLNLDASANWGSVTLTVGLSVGGYGNLMKDRYSIPIGWDAGPSDREDDQYVGGDFTLKIATADVGSYLHVNILNATRNRVTGHVDTDFKTVAIEEARISVIRLGN